MNLFELYKENLMDGSLNETCKEGVHWIWVVFEQCVQNNANLAGFIIGMVSLVLWLMPLFPQLWENYKRGSCDGLSIYFILFWFLGDSCNLTGAILTHQLEFQIYIGVYYIIADVLFLSQYAYYRYRNSHSQLSHDLGVPSPSPSRLPIVLLLVSVCIRAANCVSPPTHQHFFPSDSDEVGYIIGSISAVCYFLGRVPQLYQNYKRRSTKGLALKTFVIIIFANLTYGLSVLLGGVGVEGGIWNYELHHMPWLVGSLGCCALDTMVIGQYFKYYTNTHADEAPLINETDSDDE